MFPENKHLETFLVPNKKDPDTPSPVVEAIKVAISITIPITLFRLLLDLSPTIEIDSPGVSAIPTNIPTEPSEEQPSEGPFFPNSSDPTGLPVNPNGPNGTGEIPPDFSQETYLDGYWIRIPSSCNGFHADGANFRARPSLDVSAIKGVVLVGNLVFLTGETTHGDGIIWHRVFNESRLTSSMEHGALDILVAGQEGWIANCFVEHL